MDSIIIVGVMMKHFFLGLLGFSNHLKDSRCLLRPARRTWGIRPADGGRFLAMLDSLAFAQVQGVLLLSHDLDYSSGEVRIRVVLARVGEAVTVVSKFNFLEVVTRDSISFVVNTLRKKHQINWSENKGHA